MSIKLSKVQIGDLLGIAIERARLFDASVQLGALEERNRLAREIHDTLAQGLTAVSLRLEAADALLDAGAPPERVRQSIQQALALTRANLEEARRSVLDLRAAPLEGRGLATAIAEMAEALAARHDIDIEFRTTGASRPVPIRLEMGLYRIAQEALNNIVRHSQAHKATIALVATPEAFRLSVEDDGVGFDPQSVDKSRFGLVGLNERVRLLGGEFQLETDPGGGTRLEITIPLDRSR